MPPRISADFRKNLVDAFQHLDSSDHNLSSRAVELVERVLSAEKELVVQSDMICKYCDRRQLQPIAVKAPDLLTQLKGLEILLNQMHGKPAETRTVEVVVPRVSLRELDSLSDEELRALAAADDADWEPVEALMLEEGDAGDAV